MKCTVGTAVEVGLVDLAVQAVDGTKIPGNSSTDRTYNAVPLQKLLDWTEAAIAELEAQNMKWRRSTSTASGSSVAGGTGGLREQVGSAPQPVQFLP